MNATQRTPGIMSLSTEDREKLFARAARAAARQRIKAPPRGEVTVRVRHERIHRRHHRPGWRFIGELVGNRLDEHPGREDSLFLVWLRLGYMLVIDETKNHGGLTKEGVALVRRAQRLASKVGMGGSAGP